MKHLFVILILLPLCGKAELPDRASQLLTKLKQWEFERQVELQKEIKTKRGEVISALERELEYTTRSGDLDAALAIKKEIEKLWLPLTATGPSKDESEAPYPRSTDLKMEWFIGETWETPGGTTFAFEPDGKATKTYRGRTIALNWEILDSGVVRVFGEGPAEFFLFESRRRGKLGKSESLEYSVQVEPE